VEIAEKTFLCSITPLASGKSRVVLLHDISDMKNMERIKKDLVVNVSHELRTPLTAIKGFTETLMEESGARSAEYLGIIKRHTDRLIAMVNDLLTLSELEERPQLTLEEFDLQDIIANVLAIYEPRIRAKGLSLEAGISPITIRGDAFKLEQLLTNLMDNALKYTEKGHISIETEQKDGHAVITVSDTGIGISKEDLARVFERFTWRTIQVAKHGRHRPGARHCKAHHHASQWGNRGGQHPVFRQHVQDQYPVKSMKYPPFTRE
jgi:two-component system phosphate regulon sensor histidine kinase PhoR